MAQLVFTVMYFTFIGTIIYLVYNKGYDNGFDDALEETNKVIRDELKKWEIKE